MTNTQSKAGYWLKFQDGEFLNCAPYRTKKHALKVKDFSLHDSSKLTLVHLDKNGDPK